MRPRRFSLVGASLGLFVVTTSWFAGSASASGPVERMVQLLAHPTDPNILVVRYGVASNGYLFSRDGGRNFQALCSQVIDTTLEDRDKILRLSSQPVPSAGANLLDAQGKLVFAAPLGAMYTDDGKGCGWQRDDTFGANHFAYGLQRDPKSASDLFATSTDRKSDTGLDDTAQLMRRSGARWAPVAPLRARRAGESTMAGELLVSNTRLYASVTVNTTAGETSVVVVTSEDNGASWREAGKLPSAASDNVVLVGVDPVDPSRVLAVNYADPGPDTLLISTDQGKTFREAGKVAAASGVTFGPDGRVYVGDAGDQDADGGIWAAPRLGDPLTKIAGTDRIDCLGFDATSGKLRVCRQHRFGLMDATTGAFEELTRLDKIKELVSCDDVDVHAECSSQLNSGPSWCCTGHYSFTPFCGTYDVTKVGNKNVYCGLSGRQYDLESGRGPEPDVDPSVTPGPTGTVKPTGGTTSTRGDAGAGARRDGGLATGDEGDDDVPAARKGGGGCSVQATPMSPRSAGGALLSLGALLLVLGHRLRRRGR